MCRFSTIIGVLFYLLYYNGCGSLTFAHSIQKRQSQIEYQATIDSGSLLNLASGLQNLLNTVQKATNLGQQFQFGAQVNMKRPNNYGSGENYPGGGRGPPNGPPRGPGFGPPPGGPPRGPEFGPPGQHFGPPGQHFGPPGQHHGPPGFGRHPPPPPPPPHEGPPGRFGPPGWPGFGPPGPPHWQGFGPPGHHGPPPDFGRPPPPPPYEDGNFPPQPPNRFPPNYNNQQNGSNGNSDNSENPGIILGQNEDKDKNKIVGYLDGGFPIILLEDNEIRR